MTSVAFSPEIECQVLDVSIQLGRKFQEGLQDVPRANGCGFSCIRLVRIDQRISALLIYLGGLVRETYTNRLTEVEHVAVLVPRVRIQLCLQLFCDVARAMLLEETDKTVAARTSVEPEGEWLLLGILTGFEEPEEHVGLLVEADVSSIVINALGGFAYTMLARLLVANLGALRRGDGRHACGICRHLALNDRGCTERGSCQNSSD